MVALHDRDRTGEGQVVDVNLLDSMLPLMSALPSAAAHLGYEQPRLGTGIPYSVPRGRISAATAVGSRSPPRPSPSRTACSTLLGHGDDPRFTTFEFARGHREELDEIVGEWVGARSSTEVFAAFDEVEAAIGPVYSMHDLLADPHWSRATCSSPSTA